MKRDVLVNYFDSYLKLEDFPKDFSNNGLQIEGTPEVTKAVFGVDCCLELFKAAAAAGADFVFVHHGLSWGAEPRRFTGMVAERMSTLFNAGISLYAAHLPLDAHPEAGNNAQLADMIGLKDRVPFFKYNDCNIGFAGTLKDPAPVEGIAEYLGKKLNVDPLIYGDGSVKAAKIAVVSGCGGSGALQEAAAAGCDLLVTGEFEHVMYHPRKELGVNVIALGHYASETVGPFALMQQVQKEFGLPVEFIDVPTGL